jgi:hypothetical protein
MRRNKYIPLVFLTILSVMPGLVSQAAGGGGSGVAKGAAVLGFVYGIKGNVELKEPQKNPIRLNRETDLLRLVRSGDKLRTKEDGKLTIVSLSEKMGYELMPNTLVMISGKQVTAIRGTVNKIEGLYFPESIPPMSKKMGILVADVPLSDSCIRPLSPLSTSVITTTPSLTWENDCGEINRQVTIKLIYDKRIIYQAITGDTYMKVPKDVLNFEKNYTWLVDGGENGIVGSIFSILSEEDVKETLEKKYHYAQNEDDLHERLSYIYYLKFKGLNEMANAEIKMMKEDFPENPYIKTE